MSNIFKTTSEIVADMLADYKNITGLDLTIADLNREEVIKVMTYAGSLSLMRSELRRAYDDFFPASASKEGLIKHLAARQLPPQIAAQNATGVVRFTNAVDGGVIGIGVQIKRVLDGRIFVSIGSGVITAGIADVPFQSLLAGAGQNIDKLSQQFQLVTPITGVDNTCTNTTQFLDGRDIESEAEMLDRIQIHDRDEDSGGNIAAYERFAKEASPQVVTATSIKFGRGVGTVDTYITSGTTDIDSAVRNGDPVLRLPSPGLIATVQAYVLTENPTTDDHQTFAPTEQAFNSTITYSLYDETLRSLVDAEITKLWKIYVYEAVGGQVLHPTELERRIDQSVGHLISERAVSNFAAGPTYTVPNNKLLTPGALTLLSF